MIVAVCGLPSELDQDYRSRLTQQHFGGYRLASVDLAAVLLFGAKVE
jgi:hypothetical protein